MRIAHRASKIACAVLVLLSVSGFRAVSQAQQRASGSVIIALADDFPQMSSKSPRGGRVSAMVVRYPAGGGSDVILLRRDASPETLAGAVRLLRRVRAQEPHPQATRVSVLTGIGNSVRSGSAPTNGLARALQQVRQQRQVRIGNVGLGRWISVDDAALGR